MACMYELLKRIMICFSTVGKLILFVVAVNSALSLRNSSKLETRCYGNCGMKIFYLNVATEVQLHRTIKDELRLMKQSLNIITGFQKKLKYLAPAKANRTWYLENLSNSFALACRISNKWPPILSLMKMTFGKFIKNLELASFTTFTTDRDNYIEALESFKLKGKKTQYFYHPIDTIEVGISAMTGLVRLQETYNLTSTELAASGPPSQNGALNPLGFSAWDCYDIGVYCMMTGIPVRAAEWLFEASNRAVDYHGVSARMIMEYLHVAFCYMGDTSSHRKALHKLIDDTFFNPTEQLYYEYSDMSVLSCKQLKLNYIDLGFTGIHWVPSQVRGNRLDVAFQRSLCRKDSFRPLTDKDLRCRMIHYNQPYLKIGPLKLEEINLEPPILVFHQVISNSEINDLLEESYNQTKKAIFDYQRGVHPYQDTQMNRFLEKEDSKVVTIWDLKSATIANAGLYRSEKPMVASYGLAGEIRQHMDLGPSENVMDEDYSRGDYITLMYWLNEVEEGGFTIFPRLGLALPPVKGSAVLWFNRHPNWEEDGRVLHSGCPILSGTKWVLTKWFHVLQQEFPKCVPGNERTRKYYYLESNIID